MSYPEWAQRLGPIIPYTRKFAAMIGAGVSLARTLELLQETTDDPALAAAHAALTEKVMAGYTLSSVMAEMPEHFSSFYVAFVRAGEVGGVLDETLAERITLTPGGRELVQTMRAHGAYTCLVSGGFTLFTAFAQLHNQLVRLGELTAKALTRDLDLALEEDLPWEQWFQSG